MPTTQQDFAAFTTALFYKNTENLKKILQNFDLTATDNNGRNCLMLCGYSSSSAEVVKVILKKIEETGGPDLLKSQLTATDKYDRNCLMLCGFNSKSPEVVKVILEKIDETGDPDLFKSQLAATDNNGRNCLMLCGYSSSSAEVVKVILKKIEETGGPDLLKSQLTATDKYDRNCLMLCGFNSKSPEVVKVILEKIDETGDPDLFKSQLAATDNNGRNCLMLCGYSSSSAEVVKVILKKIEETGGPDLLKSQLTATDKYDRNCLMLCGFNSKSPEVVKVILEKIDETGGPDLLKSQLTTTDNNGKNCLMLCCKSSESPEVVKLLAAVLFELDLFKEQFAKLDDDDKNILKEKAGIDSSSWTPDAASLAEVKAILQGADATAAKKKKAEEEAANKKKAEEEEAAKKLQCQSQQQSSDQQKLDVAITTNSTPPISCFKRGVPPKNLEGSITALMSIKEAPENRPDLNDWIPDKHDCDSLLHYLNTSLKELKDRPAIKKLIAENGLTDDDIKILHSYKIQNPFPVYLWLNGWLGGDRRDDFVKENVAPFFTLLYRAMEKLPRFKTVANRAIKVNGIPALKNTFNNYETACAPKKTLSFWGFSSFSTKSDVINREEFVGKPQEEAIVYSCGELEGVDMEPFAPQGLKNEREILPLCPCVLEVVNHVKMGQKLVVGVKQLNHADFAYVVPK